jgi:hypothetical protein
VDQFSIVIMGERACDEATGGYYRFVMYFWFKSQFCTHRDYNCIPQHDKISENHYRELRPAGGVGGFYICVFYPALGSRIVSYTRGEIVILVHRQQTTYHRFGGRFFFS